MLQNGAGAFLRNNGKYLLMLRSSKREIAPNVWSCIGGHKEYTETYTEMIRHFIKTPDSEERIVLGIAGRNTGKLKMNWSILEDFE